MKEIIQANVSIRIVKFCLFLMPVAILLVLAALRYGDRHFYIFLASEDRLLEVVSAIFYLLSAILGLRLAQLLFRSSSKFYGCMFILFSLAMFFIFGEEISWGQRLFGIESGEYFLQNSSQQEINFHNLKPVQKHLHMVYILLGLTGGLLWIFRLFSKPDSLIFSKQLIPGWYLMTYFLPVSIFYFSYDYLGIADTPGGLISNDQEPVEFLLSLGFLLFACVSIKRLDIRNLNHSDEISSFSIQWTRENKIIDN